VCFVPRTVRTRVLPIVTRRELLGWASAATAISLPPLAGCTSSPSPAAAPKSTPMPSFFTSEDAAILNALADAVLPPDDLVGGSALGVVSYIETLLTAFDSNPPTVFAGGPYSGRTPLPSSTGQPSSSFPEDAFKTFLPMDRYQARAWKLRIEGSSGVAGGGPNDPITGPIVGLRQAVAKAIADAKAAMPENVTATELTIDEKTTMLRSIDPTTQSTLIELVLEGAFTAPEYGGNPNLAGWKMTYFEGDSQPLGYSWFDLKTGAYTEDPMHPVSTPNPYPDPMPLDPTTENLVATVISVLGGKVFP
jgi:hypothetical protein